MSTLSALAAIISGDLASLATHWRRYGYDAQIPGPGMLYLPAPGSISARGRLLLSVGVHGNELAPVEMLAPVLDVLLQSPQALKVDLLLAVGNPAAVTAGERFLDTDLNRLFCLDETAQQYIDKSVEANRADTLMRASMDFFQMPGVAKWHLDLHSTIRPSLHARFAILPADPDNPAQQPLTSWLAEASMDALIFNELPAGTFSAFTARECGTLSCTVELGQIGALGENQMVQLLQTQQAISQLLRADLPAAYAPSGVESSVGSQPIRYRVVQEIIKQGDDFELNLSSAAKNFTAIEAGSWIARHGATVIRAGKRREYAVFPNPGVQSGRRAALMVERIEPDSAIKPPQPVR